MSWGTLSFILAICIYRGGLWWPQCWLSVKWVRTNIYGVPQKCHQCVVVMGHHFKHQHNILQILLKLMSWGRPDITNVCVSNPFFLTLIMENKTHNANLHTNLGFQHRGMLIWNVVFMYNFQSFYQYLLDFHPHPQIITMYLQNIDPYINLYQNFQSS